MPKPVRNRAATSVRNRAATAPSPRPHSHRLARAREPSTRGQSAYEEAKRRTAAEFPNDVSAYTEAKNETIRELEARAYDEGYGERVPERLDEKRDR